LKKEEGRRKKKEGRRGVLSWGYPAGSKLQTRHVCGGSFPHKAATPTQNWRCIRIGVLNPLLLINQVWTSKFPKIEIYIK
jgi:hypothetical protein